MLSIGAMGGGQGAYYVGLAREDYYLSGGEPPGVWWGKGAADLGLTGAAVDAGALNRLFEGFHPREDRPLIQNAGAADHQPGWDLTFSAPKSVSALWSQADPATRKAIQEAHFEAVRAGLGYIEDAAAVTRRGRGGQIKEAAHLVVATFEHGTSRAQDPQLHSHCLVLNVCTRADGTSGTIESRPLYQSKMAAGALYRAELAARLERDLGLSADRSGSCFEVAGVPQKLTGEFSKRRAEIEEALCARGYDSAEAAAAATLATRRAKDGGHVPRETLFAQWRETGRSLGWGPEEAARLLRETKSPERNPGREAQEALALAEGRVTEQQSYFTRRDFVRHLAEEAQGRGMDAGAVRAAAAEHLRRAGPDSDVVALGRHKGEPVYATRAALEVEAKLLARIEGSKQRHGPGVSEAVLSGVLSSRSSLNEEQKAALRHVCGGGPGSVRVVSGMTGTGKTTLLDAARFAWTLEGFTVHGAALSGKAAKGLADGALIPSETLHRTLWDVERGKVKLGPRSILVVDGAGMVGTRQMRKLVEAIERAGARLVLVGDAKQPQPTGAGGPFPEIERRLGAATLTDVRRQREAWARGAVHDFAAGRAERGLAAYAERGLLSVGEDRRQAYDNLIAAWKVEGVRAPAEQLIFAGTRLDAAVLNRMAQAERAKAGLLGEERATSLAGGDGFRAGDRVLFTKKSRLYGVENGSLGDVAAADALKGTITARLDSGERVKVPLGEFPHVRLGYAVTTHKGQGATVERAFVLVGGTMQDREITYVQASRSRGETRLFADRETAGEDLYNLARQMETSRRKEMAHAVVRQEPEQKQQGVKEPIARETRLPSQTVRRESQAHDF